MKILVVGRRDVSSDTKREQKIEMLQRVTQEDHNPLSLIFSYDREAILAVIVKGMLEIRLWDQKLSF